MIRSVPGADQPEGHIHQAQPLGSDIGDVLNACFPARWTFKVVT